MQVPWVQATLPPGRRVGVLTICRATLTPRHLECVGAPADTPLEGTEDGREFFRVLIKAEKRDLDVDDMKPRLVDQLLSIARARLENSVRRYDRGVRWEQEGLTVHGSRWVSMYLPVWLYSYHQPDKNGGMLHYIAVNGRTGETMGSVPVQQWKLLTAAITVGTFLEGVALWILGNMS